MSLQVGSRLGHYHVTALIGEGGMGPGQATDTKLSRQVTSDWLDPKALKALLLRVERVEDHEELGHAK